MPDVKNFDPNSVGLRSNNIFGLPFTEEEAQLVLLPVPWEVTVSYRPGAARGPEKIFNAAMQVDLYDPDVTDGWKKGFYMLPIDRNIRSKSDYLKQCAELVISNMIEGGDISKNDHLAEKLKEINEGGRLLHDWVYEMTSTLLKSGKKVGLIGGDHSTPLGFIKALADVHDDFCVLQIDAHADLREAYENFTYSHASIMYNVLQQIPQVTKLVQVGIRDYCDEELAIIKNSKGRVKTFFDRDIKDQLFEGATWKDICKQVVAALPEHIYISFDIDGLDPKLCPNTGTPVPGGFDMDQVFYLFRMIHAAGKKIIGFDLNEVSSGDHIGDSIDAITGARVLFKLCNYMVAG
jgi:agmatinase